MSSEEEKKKHRHKMVYTTYFSQIKEKIALHKSLKWKGQILLFIVLVHNIGFYAFQKSDKIDLIENPYKRSW